MSGLGLYVALSMTPEKRSCTVEKKKTWKLLSSWQLQFAVINEDEVAKLLGSKARDLPSREWLGDPQTLWTLETHLLKKSVDMLRESKLAGASAKLCRCHVIVLDVEFIQFRLVHEPPMKLLEGSGNRI